MEQGERDERGERRGEKRGRREERGGERGEEEFECYALLRSGRVTLKKVLQVRELLFALLFARRAFARFIPSFPALELSALSALVRTALCAAFRAAFRADFYAAFRAAFRFFALIFSRF